MTKGTLIGAYRIDAQIGAGGMGEVYRAHDIKLRRDVALKVLPQALAGDRDRLARLEREAQLLAALNHPNIAHVYGLEETDGTRALVMELIDGDTIVFAQNFALHRIAIAENGGPLLTIAQPDPTRDEAGFDRPSLLPGGSILYTVQVRGGRSRIAARRLTGGEPKTILEDGFGAQYLPPGYLVFAQANRLMGVRFNAATLETSGTPVVLERAAFTNASEGASNVGVAADGTAVFLSGSNPGALGRLVWADRSRVHVEPFVDQPLEDPRNVRLSPDGKRVALAVGPVGQADIWSTT